MDVGLVAAWRGPQGPLIDNDGSCAAAAHPSIRTPADRGELTRMSLQGDNRGVAEARERNLQNYVTPDGKTPFEDWVSKLRDQRAKARIFVRIDRVRLGNFGDCRSAGGGVYELRVDYGPGYRVYFGILGTATVLLLCGGDKRTQSRDLENARRYWKEFKNDADKELR